MTMGERIKEVRKDAGLTQKEFSERLGYKGVGIRPIEKGERQPTKRMIMAICNEFKVCRLWLEEGIGPMEMPELNTEDLEIDLIFGRQSMEEVAAIKKLLDMPGARDIIAKIAVAIVGL